MQICRPRNFTEPLIFKGAPLRKKKLQEKYQIMVVFVFFLNLSTAKKSMVYNPGIILKT